MLKRLMVGLPLPSHDQEHQRLPKRIALATFSSDPISSTAYATEEILFVTAVGASSLALGVSKLVPMAVAVAVLLVIVVVSYRQTIYAYPNGGGAYIVSRENLGEVPSLVAGASLLVDYIMTVAVSVSAGVAAVLSLPQFATAGILVLAANTAFVDFPRLSSILARDGYLPRQFANLGDRLVFSNGIVFLAVAAGALLVAFRGLTTLLIPLYAVGVFTSFTLSQSGMVRHHLRLREPNWRRGVVINAVGAVATGIVLLIVAVTKFAVGAWLPILVVPVILVVFRGIHRHYRAMTAALAVDAARLGPDHRADRHAAVVLVGRVHKGTLRALDYARSISPDHLVAAHVALDEEDQAALEREWEELGIDVPLEIVASPYRELVEPVERFLDEVADRWGASMLTVVIPEFVVGLRSPANVLHGQSALALKLALLDRPGTVVTSVPYQLGTESAVVVPG